MNRVKSVWYLLKERMQYKQGSNRHQNYFSTLEEQVAADNAVRLIDAFVCKLDITKMGITKAVLQPEGETLAPLVK